MLRLLARQSTSKASLTNGTAPTTPSSATLAIMRTWSTFSFDGN
jgi:hypothetical protein